MAHSGALENEISISYRVMRKLRGETDWLLSYILGRIRSCPNDRVMRVFAMRRSGHHAIINWIRYHIDGKHYFLNDCKLGKNPFDTAVWESSLIDGVLGEHSIFRPGIERKRSFTYKGTLLYNYEEVDISEVPGSMSLEDEENWIGQSRVRNDILILRDPFNMLASKLRWAYGVVDRPSKPTIDEVRLARDLWKIYAREYIGETDFLNNRVNISYNDWFLSRKYRDELAQNLGFENKEHGVREVAKWGPTLTQDSFDGLKYEGRAQDMKVLDRWGVYASDPVYLEIVDDDELHRLSTAIFGELPATSRLLRGA